MSSTWRHVTMFNDHCSFDAIPHRTWVLISLNPTSRFRSSLPPSAQNSFKNSLPPPSFRISGYISVLARKVRVDYQSWEGRVEVSKRIGNGVLWHEFNYPRSSPCLLSKRNSNWEERKANCGPSKIRTPDIIELDTTSRRTLFAVKY